MTGFGLRAPGFDVDRQTGFGLRAPGSDVDRQTGFGLRASGSDVDRQTGPGARAPEPGTVGALGERALIERIRERVPPASADVLVGIGDDAAVIAADRNRATVVTTDALVEGVHFDRTFVSAYDIGHKALAVNLSDIAAMGAEPRVALLSLALPASLPIADVDAMLDGLLTLARGARVSLVGGNITRSPALLYVDVTLIGSVHPRRIVTRGGGRPGDELFVTGSIGAAAAGLQQLQTLHAANPSDSVCPSRYTRPQPRTRIGLALGRTRAATACVDLSDGLADGVAQIARASGTGAVIDAEALPIEPAAREWFSARGLDPVTAALTGGDDYELLFTVRPRHRGRLRGVQASTRGVPLTRIGHLTADRTERLVRAGIAEPLPEGFAHFG